MSDRTHNPDHLGDPTIPTVPKPAHQPSHPAASPKQPSVEVPSDYDEIPVDELIRLTRELTQRITNADRKRLEEELQESGHQRSVRARGPIELQQFFVGEIDLDTELAKRFTNAPLMTDITLHPQDYGLNTRRISAIMKSQDGGAMITFDLQPRTGMLETTFTYGSMLSFRFHLGILDKTDRRRWLDLMRRPSGIAFLWTKERWEKDYLICVVRENFARIYAFAPDRFEAAVRVTLDVVDELLDWLESHWFISETRPMKAVSVLPGEEPPLPEPLADEPDESGQSDSGAVFDW